MNTDKLVLIAITLAIFVMPSASASQVADKRVMSEPTAKSVKGRLETVDRLVNNSSGATRIKSSGNVDSEKIRQQAVDFHAKAQKAFDKGEIKGANDLLSNATMTMFKAMRLAGSGSALTGKYKHDYTARKESLDALMEAMQRVGKEKKQQKEVAGITTTVNRLTVEAKSLAVKNNYKEARKILDTAYEMAKIEIEKLRGGDTLVRSLNFANKEEEYEYELDRNDTHRMLVTVLLQEKRSKKSIDKMVTRYMGKADVLREQAEREAANKDFKKAVSTLEASTKEIVRAIRSAGIYIPG